MFCFHPFSSEKTPKMIAHDVNVYAALVMLDSKPARVYEVQDSSHTGSGKPLFVIIGKI